MLTIRPARIEDAQILHEWRNDPLTRAMSTNDNEVAWEDHLRWFAGKLEEPSCRFLIAEEDGAPVGTVRLDGEEETVLSWSVAPAHRGRGVCGRMGALAFRDAGDVVAYVRSDNWACQKNLGAAGFSLVRGGPLQIWRRKGQWIRAPGHLAETSMYVPM